MNMPNYYVAPSLVALRTEINRRWPNRDKASDGAIGDTAHSARKSDHNPDWDSGGVVRAIDVDKDGINVTELLAAVIRDPRVAYVIWNRRIASATNDGTPWDWEPYSGSNPHDKHIHISIKHTRTAETSTAKWFKIPAKPPTTAKPPTSSGDDMPLTTADLDAVQARAYKANSDYAVNFWVAPGGTGTAIRNLLTAMKIQLDRIEDDTDGAAETQALLEEIDANVEALKAEALKDDPKV